MITKSTKPGYERDFNEEEWNEHLRTVPRTHRGNTQCALCPKKVDYVVTKVLADRRKKQIICDDCKARLVREAAGN